MACVRIQQTAYPEGHVGDAVFMIGKLLQAQWPAESPDSNNCPCSSLRGVFFCNPHRVNVININNIEAGAQRKKWIGKSMVVFKKIPFQLGSEILLRSSFNPSHKAKSRIIGVLEKEFIMIENPVFAISDNITAIVEDDFLVAYLYDGYLFTFKSRFNKKLIRNIICIDYPGDFEVEQLRTEPRVKVNLAAALRISDLSQSGLVKDISETGCSFELPKIISLFKGLGIIATFTLPNDQLIKNLQCTITTVKYNQIHRRTEIGARFLMPAEEISKIQELVHFCMRFRV